MTHKFMVGQTVAITREILRPTAAGKFEILHLMPAADGDPENPSYRVKHTSETHERVVRESEITLWGAAA